MITSRGWVSSYSNPRLRSLWCYAVLTGFVLFLAGRLAAAPQWRVLETPRFTLVSQTSERRTRECADQYNQFIDAMKLLFRVDERLLAPLTIVMFDREKDFAPYRPLSPDGKPMEWVTGYFGRRDTWCAAGLLDRWDDESMRRNIYQNGAFWILSADNRRQPLWLTTGVSQVFSTFMVGEQNVKWGDVIEAHVRRLRTAKLMPMERFLFTTRTDKAYSDRDGPDLFHAQSWLFIHYLLFGQRKGAQGTLSDFMTAIQDGTSMEEAFKKTFGLDYAGMEDELDRYLDSGRFRIVSQPRSATPKITEPLVPALPAAVQTALGKLALSTRRIERAVQHAEEAVRLDPAHAAGQQLLAWVKVEAGELDAALVAAEKSVQLGAKDADAFFILAYTKAKKARSLGGIPPVDARQISNLYEKAINACPALKVTYINLAGVLGNLDGFSDQDELFIDQGVRLFPDEPAMQVGRANILRKKGNKEEALKVLDAVCADPGKLAPEQLKSYTMLKSNWVLNDLQMAVNDLMKQKKPKDALALLEGMLKQNPPPEIRARIIRQRWDALASAKLQEARAAAADGRTEEAMRLYQEVVGMEQAPARARGIARTALQKLPGPASSMAAGTPIDGAAEK